MRRIAWIEESEARGRLADLFEAARSGAISGIRREHVPDILRQVQRLRDVGWTEAQIAEAVYDGALFNLFVRLADAFDIHPPAVMDPGGVPGAITRP